MASERIVPDLIFIWELIAMKQALRFIKFRKERLTPYHLTGGFR